MLDASLSHSGLPRSISLELGCVLLSGCAGGAPLLYPAHPLPRGEVSFGAGTSATFALGEPNRATDRAAVANSPSSGVTDPAAVDAVARGSVASALLTPGLAPWTGARAGIGWGAEAGIAYTGRSARVDGRYAPLLEEQVAVSVGLGATALLPDVGSQRPGSIETVDASGQIPGLSTRRLTGWGLDLPAIVGWRSSGEVVSLWAGPRVGVERMYGDADLQLFGAPAQEAAFEGTRWYAGGVLGLSVGVRPVWVALELDGAYQDATGRIRLRDATPGATSEDHRAHLTGWLLTPAAALIGRF